MRGPFDTIRARILIGLGDAEIAQVIESALEFRRLSAADPGWTGRVLSALREQFGRHPVDGSG